MSNGIFTGNPRFKGKWYKEHSLSLVLAALLIVQSSVFHFTEYPDWASTQQVHGLSASLGIDYWTHYAAEWSVSVLADTYGALLLVLFSKWFFEQGSSESKNMSQQNS